MQRFGCVLRLLEGLERHQAGPVCLAPLLVLAVDGLLEVLLKVVLLEELAEELGDLRDLCERGLRDTADYAGLTR